MCVVAYVLCKGWIPSGTLWSFHVAMAPRRLHQASPPSAAPWRARAAAPPARRRAPATGRASPGRPGSWRGRTHRLAEKCGFWWFYAASMVVSLMFYDGLMVL